MSNFKKSRLVTLISTYTFLELSTRPSHLNIQIEPCLSLCGANRLYTFPPAILNAFLITIKGGYRTINICEGWNNGFSKIVGHSHPQYGETLYQKGLPLRRTRLRLLQLCNMISRESLQPSEHADILLSSPPGKRLSYWCQMTKGPTSKWHAYLKVGLPSEVKP